MFLSDILVPYIFKNFSDYNWYQIIIYLNSHLNIHELYYYEFYEKRSVFDASIYNLMSPKRFQIKRIPLSKAWRSKYNVASISNGLVDENIKELSSANNLTRL